MSFFESVLAGLGTVMGYIDENVLKYFTLVSRIILPVLCLVILIRVARSLFREKSEAEQWGYLSMPNGARIPLNHWENTIGRSQASDVFMSFPSLSRNHAAIIRNDKGQWRVYDNSGKGNVKIRGKLIETPQGAKIKTGDIISLAGIELVFVASDRQEEYRQSLSRTKPGKIISQRMTLLFVTELQALLMLQLCISKGEDLTLAAPICFALLATMMWTCYIVTRILRRVAFEIETLAFFLCTIGLAVTGSSSPGDLYRQLLFLIAGIGLFFTVGWFLRDLDRAKQARRPIAAAGLLLLCINIIFSQVVLGAKNWLQIGPISFQPSEFVKIAFIFAGAATLDRLFTRRNLLFFVGFSGLCVLALALMRDYGTALVFFAAYLVIAFLRSGDFATIFLSVSGAGFAGFLAMSLKAHVAARFASWGHAWANANSGGYQQTRTMAAASSGGLFGVGAGEGWLKRVFAADTDLVFGMLAEELGLIAAVCAIFAILLLAVFTVRSAESARSSFYVIGACATAAIYMAQLMLNVFGSVDILPLTGVTFPFVSKGGSSLIACWGMLAFIKSSDTRQNASFVIKTPKKPKSSRRKSLDTAGETE